MDHLACSSFTSSRFECNLAVAIRDCDFAIYWLDIFAIHFSREGIIATGGTTSHLVTCHSLFSNYSAIID